MEIRDPVHGSIQIEDEFRPILHHDFFHRLRGIKQLGLSEYIFPGATHTRFIHSIGVMDVADKAFRSLFKDKPNNKHYNRLRATLKLGCLLHDIGHAPLSHSTEVVMPQVDDLQLSPRFVKKFGRQATHEDYTVKAIVDSTFTNSFERVKKTFGIDPNCVAELILGETQESDYFIVDGVNYFPILHQLVSSELDCDRMDYLLRDSYFCGVSYGNFDLDWIIDNLTVCTINNEAYLGITERSISTFDDFLLSRYHMFIMVYFHYKSVCLEKLLAKYFHTSQEYRIPADIEEYQVHDDHFLMKVLRNSQNKYAKHVIENDIPKKIYESFDSRNIDILEELEKYLVSENIEYIKGSSKGRLSKYYTQDEDQQPYSIKVVRSFPRNRDDMYIPIDEATTLFQKYSETHNINRLHCWESELTESHKKSIEKIIFSS